MKSVNVKQNAYIWEVEILDGDQPPVTVAAFHDGPDNGKTRAIESDGKARRSLSSARLAVRTGESTG
jgi:hypothetical protein